MKKQHIGKSRSHSRWRKLGALIGVSTLLATLTATTAVGAQTGELCQGQQATIVGTDGDDTLIGTSGRDIISGLEGNDIIRGLGGNDLVCGGPGADTIAGGFGNDGLYGNAGPDTILGGGGADFIHGGFGIDTLQGGAGPDELVGSRNADTIYGNDGADTLYGGRGNDTLIGGAHADALNGGNGNDELLGGQGPDILRPGNGADITDGGPGTDRVGGKIDPADLSSNLDLDLTGLEPLGEGFVYEGWVIIDGAPVSTGRFDIEADGSITLLSDSLADDLTAATAVVITIEPAVDPDPGPADPKPLAGDVVNGVAELSVAHPAALGDDFSTAGGSYFVATPTTESVDDEYSGVWFIDVSTGSPAQGLELPELPAGWIYEGWAVIDGQPVSTGRFLDPGAPDDFGGFSGPLGNPPFPGEDFIVNAPDGLTFPTDLRGDSVVISIEPIDDDSPAPFAFKPLASQIPEGVDVPYVGELGAGPALPTGIATIIPPDVSTNVSLDLTGLEPLGSGFVYEGWVIIDGAPVSTGRFAIEADGSQTLFTSSLADDVSTATTVVITIEPAVDPDPGPADPKPLAGDVVDGVAELSVAHPAALGDDFSTAGGSYFIATPTTANNADDDYSGVWFIDVSTGAPQQGLDVPTLPAGWVYEGWAVIDGQPVSTGRFVDPGAPDDFSGFSGPDGSPPFPGEDFIVNAPDGLTFPTDIRGGAIVLSIEPADDDSPAPFAFKPLASDIPEGVDVPYVGELGAGPALPTGVATLG